MPEIESHEQALPKTPAAASAGPRLRAGEAWELVVFDRLSGEEQAAFVELLADPDFYGLLKPRQAGARSWKAANRDTALLLLTLREPGPLPFFAAREPDAAEAISGLVLDGVLELEHEGRFVSGAAALEHLSATAPARPLHALARLSEEALRFAARHGTCCPGAAAATMDLSALSAELYGFHRHPVTPAWSRLLSDSDAVFAYLGLAADAPARQAAERSWEIAVKDDAPGWIFFSRRRAGAPRGDGSFKLYVSPAVEDLPRAFSEVLRTAARLGVGRLKVGWDAAGLLRPDKLVLYFGELGTLLAVARELEGALAGVTAHGVPFSAPIDSAGLLSWGSDPPAAERPLSWQGPESWRTWLTRRLASALLAAATDDYEAAARFALERLARDGVDVERWVPTPTLFKAA